MARKKKGDAGGIIFLLAIAVLILIALATPIVLIFGYMYNKVKAGEIKKRISGTMSDFWFNKSEKDEFKEKVNQLIQVNGIIEKANEKGTNAGITRNKDGSFSARSNLGKEIRATLEKYEPVKSSLGNYLYDLQNLPLSRWEEFNGYIKNAKSFMWSLILWCAALLYYFITLGKQSISKIFIPYLALATNFFRDEANQLPIVDGDIQMVAVATIIAILTYFIFRMIFNDSGSKYSPRPEKVSLENIDSY
jgi:hypothetical protein